MKAIKRPLPLVCFLFLLTSCALTEPKSRPADIINYDDLHTGHIVFAGITSSVDDWNYEQRLTYSKIARDAIAAQRKEFEVKTTEWLVEKLGKQDLLSINDTLKTKAPLAIDILQKFKEQLNDVRYIIFARVDGDTASKDESQKSEVYGKKTIYSNVYTTTRQMKIFVEIYDLERLILAWSDSISTAVATENHTPHSDSKSPLKDITNSILESIVFGTDPEPAPTNEMIRIAFSKIGNLFPTAKCSDVWRPQCPDIQE